MARRPRVDDSSPLFETIKFVYDDINDVEGKIDEMKPSEYRRVPSQSEDSSELFRIVTIGNTTYLYVKTSRGWKYAQLT